jgi:hypothetical protein
VNYLPGLALNQDPPDLISASWVARIIGVTHQLLALYIQILISNYNSLTKRTMIA